MILSPFRVVGTAVVRFYLSLALLVLLSLTVGPASATLFDRGNGLIYDDVLDITWLQDANHAATELTDARRDAIINAVGSVDSHVLTASDFIKDAGGNYTGQFSWWGAVAWVDQLAYESLGGWRLPAVSPINGSSFDINLSSNATTDRGTAPTTTDGTDGGWRDVGGNPVSEMGHMYYVNLANLGRCDPNLPFCTEQSGQGLNNTSFIDGVTGQTVPLDNIQPTTYWSGTEFDSSGDNAWDFVFDNGIQEGDGKDASNNLNYAWAVRDGDVLGVIPIDGDLQECTEEGGSQVVFALSLPNNFTAESIDWFLDDVHFASGELMVTTFVDVDEHLVEVEVLTTEGEFLTGASPIEIVDTTRPEITVSLAGPNGHPATSSTRNVTMHFDAFDVCDLTPVTMATGGTQMFDGETIRVQPNKGSITVPGDAFTVTVTATDASDNTAVEEVVLPLAP